MYRYIYIYIHTHICLYVYIFNTSYCNDYYMSLQPTLLARARVLGPLLRGL